MSDETFTPEEFETRKYRKDLRDRVDQLEGDVRALRDDIRELNKDMRELKEAFKVMIDSETKGLITRNRDVKSAFLAMIVTLGTVMADKLF